jgi:hypothetical protein
MSDSTRQVASAAHGIGTDTQVRVAMFALSITRTRLTLS